MQEDSENVPISLAEYALRKAQEQLKKLGQDPDAIISFTWRFLTERLKEAKKEGTPASFFQLGYTYAQVIYLFRDYGEARVKRVIGFEEFKRVFREIEKLSCFDVKK